MQITPEISIEKAARRRHGVRMWDALINWAGTNNARHQVIQAAAGLICFGLAYLATFWWAPDAIHEFGCFIAGPCLDP
ncbi:hypothetical protein [Pelagibius litoralis]|uniref:hypothetical protein n=1 Tax=Pelagibius litoralis TaxID=374515 RepID=UPI00197CEF18|nr:hypothetical protein [Pelagibius litoralis]